MGRQIGFYARTEDIEQLLLFLQKDGNVLITAIDSDQAQLEAIPKFENVPRKTLAILRRDVALAKREWIPDSGYFRLDILHLPVMELSPSIECVWEGNPAMVLGRVYGQFDDYLKKPPEFSKWFDQICRWIRKNWRRSPTNFGGYVGPAAYHFYERGGLLLPSFNPPPTAAWKIEMSKQHSELE